MSNIGKWIVAAIAAPAFLFLTLPRPAQAQHNNAAIVRPTPGRTFYIPPQYRVRVPGACFWECTESVGGALGHGPKLKGIAVHKKTVTDGGARQPDIRAELDKRGVPYRHQNYHTGNYAGLIRNTEQGHGVIVGVQTRRHDPTPTSGHAIVIVGATPDKTTFWNPAAPNRLGTVNAGEFKRDWFGNSLVILPPPPAHAVTVYAVRKGK